jgi:hypothetical protein
MTREQGKGFVEKSFIFIFFLSMTFEKVESACDRFTQYNKICYQSSSYDGNQWHTCYENNDIISFGSNHSNGCYGQSHCWYACQMERHSKTNGFIHPDCQCAPWTPFPACNSDNRGKKICRSIKSYFGFQYMSCYSSRYIKKISHNTFDCSADYCWYPCQHEKHGKTRGDVSPECSCHYSSGDIMEINFMTVVIMAASSLMCLIY